MKRILLIIAMIIPISSFAQIQSANLTASGLTCSMCSKAIYASLLKVPTILEVKVDIKKSSYLITFKEGVSVSLDEIKKAVEDAGFSVASLKVTANFSNTELRPNGQISLQGNTYHFINAPKVITHGTQTFSVVDKNYLPAKEYRKYEKYITEEAGPDRVYHITLF
jgi:copper chaperone CopZ